jgi:cell division septation protein DedD
MAGLVLKSWIVAGMTCVALTACEPGTGNAPQTEAAGSDARPATSVRLVDHDVEAPEVFQTEDKGLWDGRPSLGGVWVASPDAKNPERVIMRNPANGKFVIGGLFQRDASLPGPKLQLSSDAADALGLLAGEPVVISVTALRREEAQAPTPDATKPLLDANEAVAGAGQTSKGQTDVVATATAALDGVSDTAKPVAGKPSDKSADKPSTKPAAQAQTAAQPATEPAVQPAAEGSGALIQIGIFSVEANAKRASDVLAKAGIPASITKETSHGKDLWSVTARGNAAVLSQIKSAGFKDAYVLRR